MAFLPSQISALKTLWAALPAGNTVEQNLDPTTSDGPNASVPAGTVDVPIADIEAYLSMNGILSIIEAWQAANPVTLTTPPSTAQIAARELLRTISSPHLTIFQTSNKTTLAALEGMLSALSQTTPPLLSAQNVTDLTNMTIAMQPWWQVNGFTAPISVEDLEIVGLA